MSIYRLVDKIRAAGSMVENVFDFCKLCNSAHVTGEMPSYLRKATVGSVVSIVPSSKIKLPHPFIHLSPQCIQN